MSLINCPDCENEISSSAKTCPYCGYKFASKFGCGQKVALIILAIIFLPIFVLLIPKCDNSNSINSNSGDTYNERLALNLSTDYVKQNLKTPSTAKFPDLFESENHVEDIGGGRYEINSWVDYENLFGAQVRSNYHCIMVNVDEETWNIEDLIIDQ